MSHASTREPGVRPESTDRMSLSTPARCPVLSRRNALKTGAAALAAAITGESFITQAASRSEAPEEAVAFLDTPPPGENQLDWGSLKEWVTPTNRAFNVQHYGVPKLEAANFELHVTGLVRKPRAFSLDELKALPRKNQLMTLECSGNGSSKTFMNAIYNSEWTGVPLGVLLERCGLERSATEVVFLGADRKEETLRKGTPRELTIQVPFGRSLSIEDASSLPVLLAYERNGQPMEARHGAPLRLIVPGWYGVASVKWLTRIEVRDHRYMGRFMGRDYVTVRGQNVGGDMVYSETSVTRINLKSVVARLTRSPARDQRIPVTAHGAAWNDGTKITRVEVRLDDEPWRPAVLDRSRRDKYSWIFFSADLGPVKPGTHTVVSRAFDANQRMQPSASDDEIASKKTYWEAYEQWPRQFRLEA